MPNQTDKALTATSKMKRPLQCPGCSNIFQIKLAQTGKDIHFMNLVTWQCPTCQHQNVTPFLNGTAS